MPKKPLPKSAITPPGAMAFAKFVRGVKAPYGQYTGSLFEVIGKWWGTCAKGDDAKVLKMKLTDFNQTRVGTTGKGKAFKVTS